MSTHQRRHLGRTNLFLVRVWLEDTPTPVDADATVEALNSNRNVGEHAWCGSIQRVVDGESRRFQGLDSLEDALLAMLLETMGKAEP